MPHRDFLIFYSKRIEDKLVLYKKKIDLPKCDITNLGNYSQAFHPLSFYLFFFLSFFFCAALWLLSLGTLHVRFICAVYCQNIPL